MLKNIKLLAPLLVLSLFVGNCQNSDIQCHLDKIQPPIQPQILSENNETKVKFWQSNSIINGFSLFIGISKQEAENKYVNNDGINTNEDYFCSTAGKVFNFQMQTEIVLRQTNLAAQQIFCQDVNGGLLSSLPSGKFLAIR